MSNTINETHDPNLKSWVALANDLNTDFPLQNLPFGVYRHKNSDDKFGIGVAIGEQILDLSFAVELINLDRKLADRCKGDSLGALLQTPPNELAVLRSGIADLLSAENSIQQHAEIVRQLLTPVSEAEMKLPAQIGDYTDFYASIFHATNIGKMFRPDNPLLPNYKHIPIGYHGRASSVVVSGMEIRRPCGQTKKDDEAMPTFGASKVLDYEIELGFFVGQGNELGTSVDIGDAENHIFGLCLVNDWSARDLQRWEYQPLGPFLAKSFATTISPWVVTMEALAPFRTPAFVRDENDPQPLAYLDSPENRAGGGFDINIDLFIASQKMREQNLAPIKLVSTNAKYLYWTLAQMLTHHTSNGCNLRAGDLIASGTISGEAKDSFGSLMEFTWQGSRLFELPSGEIRKFLEDGDEVIMRGYCERAGFRRIGFGECRSIVCSANC